MPLDAVPNLHGNVTARPGPTPGLVDVWADGDAATGHGTQYLPHHATCPGPRGEGRRYPDAAKRAARRWRGGPGTQAQLALELPPEVASLDDARARRAGPRDSTP